MASYKNSGITTSEEERRENIARRKRLAELRLAREEKSGAPSKPKKPRVPKVAKTKEDEATDLRVQQIERLLKAKEAQDDLIKFAELMMPNPDDYRNPNKSRYQAQEFHHILANSLMDIEAGINTRLIICLPPRVGKSQLSSRFFPAWFMGKDPTRHFILVGYGQHMAERFGKDVRNIMKSDLYHEVFPQCSLQKGSAASGYMVTEQKGEMVFTGVNGVIKGSGGHVVVLDDLIKDRKEAHSDLIRNQVWEWFTGDAMSRMMNSSAAIVCVATRCHEDDVIGRLTDPLNVHYNEEEAKQWTIINMPALAEDGDLLGREEGESIWPEKFSKKYFEGFRRRNSQEFYCVYQQQPAPEDGNEITKDMILTYKPGELPKELRIYAASDHAYGTNKENDPSCFVIAGVCKNKHLWLIDCFWKRVKPEVAAAKMADLMVKYKVFEWIVARDHISATLEPLIRREMQERGVYCKMFKSTEHLGKGSDKLKKAQTIIGMMGMGMVHFPEHSPWIQGARSELLKFPNGAHDDFVDAISHMGRRLSGTIRPDRSAAPENNPALIVGTMAWVIASSKAEEAMRNQKQRGGW